MKIGVTSENKLKLLAVTKAYNSLGIPADIIGFAANSRVGEQPVGDQTTQGARNRISDLRTRIDGLDRIISIENGIFRVDAKWLDKAVVIIYNPHLNREFIGYSDPVIFPDRFVEQAREVGFDTKTVGQVMFEANYVSDPKDPHLSISGTSRQVYLERTVHQLVLRTELP